jgi:FkbM family methyltransferase
MSILRTLSFIANHPLNRERKAQSLLRFAKWQVGSRLVGGKTINNWINGTRLIAYPGEAGATGNIYCGLHEFADMAYVLHVVTKDDLFVDVGANIGAYTVLACGAKGARGLCFEPVPMTYQRLNDNLRLNNLTERVVAMNIGVADIDGDLAFSTDADTTNRIVSDRQYDGDIVKVPVRTLDSVVADASPAVIKIDVEGYEYPVVVGARKTLANPSLHSVIMELNGSGAQYGYDEASIMTSMDQHGFAPYAYDPFLRKLAPIDNIDNRDSTEGNLIFVRDRARVEQQIASAPLTRIGSAEL